MDAMCKITQKLCLLTLLAIPSALHAQGWGVVRGGCTPGLANSDTINTTRAAYAQKRLKTPTTRWDSRRVYKQLVVLVAYSDTDFSREDPQGDYNKIFNEAGYNEGLGAGCVADYFREQSAGLFNVEFDVFGPYKTTTKAQPYTSPTSNTKNYGTTAIKQATDSLIANHPELNYKQYDWDGNGYVDQVIYVVAGYTGNQGSKKSYGYLWPNTGTISTVKCPDGTKISDYTASAELWLGNTSCGIGTICHEYSHTLGLPDIYPTTSSKYYSICDEWDLMDGGNFTNKGWCPPNYTAQEKIYMGWLTPIELTDTTTITGMKAVSEGGETYIIRHTDSEYFLLENRQWTGWDACSPGRGLVITHVDFDGSVWRGNSVNINEKHLRYDLVHADNLDYEQWHDVITERKWDAWTDMDIAMHSHYLATSPYPWQTDSTTFVNREFTDTSTPAAVTFYKNADGERLLSKSISNISMTPDGLISFDFLGNVLAAITEIKTPRYGNSESIYDLQGRRVENPRRGIYIRNGKKLMIR